MGMHDRVRGAILGMIAALCLPRAVHAQGDDEEADAAAPGATEPVTPEPPTKTAPAQGDDRTETVGVYVPPPVASMTPSIAPKQWTFEPYGYLRMQYRIVQNDPNVQFIGRDDGFELQNARFGVRATRRNVSLVLAAEGAVDERLQVNIPDGKLRFVLRDAFADVGLGGELLVRAGYFLSWVDPDLDDDIRRAFVDRPIESRGVRPTQGFQTRGLTPGRSLGAALRLNTPSTGSAGIGFELAVQNGADEYASDNDNDTPSASASVLVRLPKGGALIASGRFNRRTEGALPQQRDEDDLEATAGGRFIGGPLVLAGGIALRRTSFPTTGGPVQNGFGAHGQVLFRIPGTTPITFGYRFGILDVSSLILTDRVMEHTAGASLAIPHLHLRFQLQAVHVVEQAARTLSNDRIQLAGEVVL